MPDRRAEFCRSRAKHNRHGTPEYWAWILMKKRCYNANWEGFARYGGRGIRVCAKWVTDFQAFYSDLGPKPGPRYTLGRIDNDGDYEPGNCQWFTWVEQANNRSNNRLVTYRNRPMTLRQAIRLAGDIVHKDVARHRFAVLGWSIERAIETPAARQKNNTTLRP